jgi:hypothetical protein
LYDGTITPLHQTDGAISNARNQYLTLKLTKLKLDPADSLILALVRGNYPDSGLSVGAVPGKSYILPVYSAAQHRYIIIQLKSV